MKGYKAFLPNMTTQHVDDTVYEVGKTYIVEGEIKICENGYHFCKKCGHESIVERNCDGWAEPPNYCPHCGARVVRDEV